MTGRISGARGVYCKQVKRTIACSNCGENFAKSCETALSLTGNQDFSYDEKTTYRDLARVVTGVGLRIISGLPTTRPIAKLGLTFFQMPRTPGT
jgi:hypothetical protein